MNQLTIDITLLRKKLVSFIKEEFLKTGLKKAVLGLSGGVDSALVAFLAAEALGKDNVHAICMPYKSSNPESEIHAKLVAQKCGIDFRVVNITPMLDSYFKLFPDADMLRRGNKMARERMTILFDHSAMLGGLVIGTSNKTERMLGYGTLYGDTASSINPIGDIYKTQVWALSEEIGIPKEIIDKQPSADLWTGQTDEGELGFTYAEADHVLFNMLEMGLTREKIIDGGIKANIVDMIIKKIKTSDFKRCMPLMAEINQGDIQLIS